MSPSLIHQLHAAVVREEVLRTAREHHAPPAGDRTVVRASPDRVAAHERERALVRASLLLSAREPGERRAA
jgi:hypothetical protein